MGVYSIDTDYADKTFKIDARLIAIADAQVDAHLADLGIAQTDLTLPAAILTQLAVAIGSYQACIEKGIGEDTLLLEKAKQYKVMIESLKTSVTRKSLGLTEVTGAGFGFFTIGRA